MKVITVFLEYVNFSRELRCEINEFQISCNACQNAVFPNKSCVWASKIFINSRYALIFNNPSTAGCGVGIDKAFYRQSSVVSQQNFICIRFQNILRRWCFDFEFFDLWFNCDILMKKFLMICFLVLLKCLQIISSFFSIEKPPASPTSLFTSFSALHCTNKPLILLFATNL